jgi:hypothetical protein
MVSNSLVSFVDIGELLTIYCLEVIVSFVDIGKLLTITV